MTQTTVKAVAGFIRFPTWDGDTVLVRAREVKRMRAAPVHTPDNLSRSISIIQGVSEEEIERSCREHRVIVMDDDTRYLTDAALDDLELALLKALKP